MKKSSLSIYWSRRDFRTHDNPALSASIQFAKDNSCDFLPIFIVENYMTNDNPKYQFGLPSRYMITQLMPGFMSNFNYASIIHGRAVEIIQTISQYYNITVFVNDDIYPDFYKQINRITNTGINIRIVPDALSINPEIRTGNGNIYSIFTPFKRKVWDQFVQSKTIAPPNLNKISYLKKLKPKMLKNKSIKIIYHGVGEKINLKNIEKLFPLSRHIHIGKRTYDLDDILKIRPVFNLPYHDERSAEKYFKKFLKEHMDNYVDMRNSLSENYVSYMSPALAWGLISARIIMSLIQKHYHNYTFRSPDAQTHIGPTTYISELIWREFYRYLLYHYPELHNTEFQERFRNSIIWAPQTLAHKRFIAWITGTTGYPLVDAAMMQLAKTGYMHNRTRMVVASILTKNLGVDWRWGQEYFRAMLIDLDECSNNGGWQWGASVGADPKPIRIFNPELQAKNYDADGSYQKHWLGENRYFWDTVEPIIPHPEARQEALQRYGLKNSENH